MKSSELAEAFLMLSFAMYGAAAHTLMANRADGKQGWALMMVLAVNCVIAGFAGLIGLFAANIMNLGVNEKYLFVAMTGFMGGKFLELIELTVLRRLKPNVDDGKH